MCPSFWRMYDKNPKFAITVAGIAATVGWSIPFILYVLGVM